MAQTEAIPMVERYFGRPERALVAQEFIPGRGWRRSTWRKTVSESWLRKLKAKGVTSVELQVPGGRVADFTVAELLASARSRRAPHKSWLS